jgi:hypothetical protein
MLHFRLLRPASADLLRLKSHPSPARRAWKPALVDFVLLFSWPLLDQLRLNLADVYDFMTLRCGRDDGDGIRYLEATHSPVRNGPNVSPSACNSCRAKKVSGLEKPCSVVTNIVLRQSSRLQTIEYYADPE